jgi:hypothetical protein
MNKLTGLDWVAFILVIIGGLNLALSAMGWNVVDMIFGAGSTLEHIVYYLVGLSALYMLISMGKYGRSM